MFEHKGKCCSLLTAPAECCAGTGSIENRKPGNKVLLHLAVATPGFPQLIFTFSRRVHLIEDELGPAVQMQNGKFWGLKFRDKSPHDSSLVQLKYCRLASSQIIWRMYLSSVSTLLLNTDFQACHPTELQTFKFFNNLHISRWSWNLGTVTSSFLLHSLSLLTWLEVYCSVCGLHVLGLESFVKELFPEKNMWNSFMESEWLYRSARVWKCFRLPRQWLASCLPAVQG